MNGAPAEIPPIAQGTRDEWGTRLGHGLEVFVADLPGFGEAGGVAGAPSQPAAIMATAESQPPLAGMYMGVWSGRRMV